MELGVEASKSSKIPKYIRYPLIIIILLTCTALIGLILFVGIMILKESLIAGSIIILIGLIMLTACVIKFRNTYIKIKEKKTYNI